MLAFLSLNKAAVAGAIMLVAFAMGWTVNGWRWSSKAQELAASYTKASVEAEKKSRLQERSIQAAADTERSRKDAEITIVRGQLDTALIELRRRPPRGANLPSASGTCPAATGAQLSREDAEFLARESARANEMKAALLACYGTYNAARNSMR
jgi:hypothetical protein